MMDLSFWLHPSSILLGRLYSFNPCYDGFVFLTWIFPASCSPIALVSILVMMDLSFWPLHHKTTHHDTLVSILVMMDLSFWPHPGQSSLDLPFLFQSLLWWICLFDIQLFILHQIFYTVSILVMMDLSFWHIKVFRHSIYLV